MFGSPSGGCSTVTVAQVPSASAKESRPPLKRSIGKRILIAGGALLLLIALILLAAYLVRDLIVRRVIERALWKETGLRAEVGRVETNLRRAEGRIVDLRIYNPPGLDHPILLHIPELFLVLDTTRLGANCIHLGRVRLAVEEFNVIKARDGRLNVLVYKPGKSNEVSGSIFSGLFKKRKSKDSDDFEFTGISELTLSLNTFRYIDLAQPRHNREFALGVTNEVIEDIVDDKDLESRLSTLAVRIFLQEMFERHQKKRGSAPVMPRP
jgi:hypothetical protein